MENEQNAGRPVLMTPAELAEASQAIEFYAKAHTGYSAANSWARRLLAHVEAAEAEAATMREALRHALSD